MIDKCIGYARSDLEEREVRKNLVNFPVATSDFDYSIMANIREKYIREDEE